MYVCAILYILTHACIYRLSGYKSTSFKYTDNRVKLTNEVLQGIRAIKSYNWERPFAHMLSDIRKQELTSLKKSANIRAILAAILAATPSFVAVITLAVYTLLGNKLTPTKVFTALALFNQLRFPLQQFPTLLNTLVDGKISIKRLSQFLQASEVQGYVERDTAGHASHSNNSTVRDNKDGIHTGILLYYSYPMCIHLFVYMYSFAFYTSLIVSYSYMYACRVWTRLSGKYRERYSNFQCDFPLATYGHAGAE